MQQFNQSKAAYKPSFKAEYKHNTNHKLLPLFFSTRDKNNIKKRKKIVQMINHKYKESLNFIQSSWPYCSSNMSMPKS